MSDMMIGLYIFSHETLGCCFWTIPTIILGIVLVILILVHTTNQKKRAARFAKELEEKIEAAKNHAADLAV